MKIYYVTLLIILIGTNCMFGQYNYEREHRIRKDQFPVKAFKFLDKHLTNAKRLRFYKEIDSVTENYEAKFKKDRLWYGAEFDAAGALEIIEIVITPVDIPQDTYYKINTYFKDTFNKYRVKKIQQQYPITELEIIEVTLKNAFQNLLLPTLFYKITVADKEDKNNLDYEVVFDAQGNFKTRRERLPPNYDRVLY